MWKCTKVLEKKKGENLKDVKLAQTRCQNLSISTIDCELGMVMGGVFWRGGNWKIVQPTIIIQLKLKGSCILCNVIEFFDTKKITKIERGGPFSPLKLQMILA
jgi:hypothetical protein